MRNDDKKKDIIPIESFDWEMISNGEKWVLFQKELIEPFNTIMQHLYQDIETVYFPKSVYLQDSQTQVLLGEATTSLIFYLLYDDDSPDTLNGLAKSRNDALKEIYFEWCANKSIKPNLNEGWFKSKKFTAYLDKIGWGSNYALFINDVVGYDSPK